MNAAERSEPPPKPRTSLRGDDVVFMYAATDAAVYTAYGCTFLAWGGASGGESVRALTALGIHPTGSMWCLTAGADKLYKDADLRDAVARDIELKPIPVWWLFDNTHEGVLSWFGCSNHPAFRAFLRQRVAEEMRGGAPGLHVDDHLGTAHTTAFLGGCFCDHCMSAFRDWLKKRATAETMTAAGVKSWNDFDYRTLVRQHAADDATYRHRVESIPLRAEFLDCQLQLAAENVRQMGALAAEIVQRPITLSANTALPELPHLAVTPHLSHLVGEVPHHAEAGTASLLDAVHAYRMASAMNKPLAATARGQDWAWVKEHDATRLVQIWIALGYCMGHRLMAPHRQWCFTLEKGSHWYDGPAEAFAPLYRFVRRYPDLFYETTVLGPLAPPPGTFTTFDTVADRAKFQSALAEGDPRPSPAGTAWLFPRRAADGSLLIHVLNLDYHADGDRLTPQRDLHVQVPSFGIDPGATATLYSYDAEPTAVPVQVASDMLTLTLPQIRLWTVVAVRRLPK